MMHAETSESPAGEMSIDTLITRVRSEYIELPGLQLTPGQAQRLWALERAQCDTILAALVEAAFLRRTRHGSYVRATGSY
jgi:ribose/xylose/arabinose/galactoside ABC-type transport system permease subunit